MSDYGREYLKEKYADELNEVYIRMLAQEKEKYAALNKQRNQTLEEMLEAFAKYDVATKGGKNRDLNTLNVEIFTKIERFKEYDQDEKLMEQLKSVEGSIWALEKLIKK